ncbi:hypothetical protein FSP39_021213 [Pinctada imbricata]|uniref:Uncharacterized protein n=1 Tax=Pinctada imbricata TaxID=66713 RepID=A0AA88YLH4_PINIB|nr:hypothetical protein FSP39_021213 [Pinctada imbricata]
MMHLNTNKDIGCVRNELLEVKTRVTDIEKYVENLEQSLTDINEKSIVNIEQSISDEAHEREKLEQWGRKWNIVVKGVEGNTKETPRETDHKVRSFFVTSLKLDDRVVGGMIFQAVHRLPSGDPSKRNIIVRLNSLIDKEDVIQAARKLPKGSGYSVIPDLNPTANKLRIHLLGELRSMPQEQRKSHRLIYLKDYSFVAIDKIKK